MSWRDLTPEQREEMASRPRPVSAPEFSDGCEVCGEIHGGQSRDWYVAARTGYQATLRTRLVLGPYPTHEEAAKHLSRGRAMAERDCPDAWTCRWGTASVPRGSKVDVLYPHPEEASPDATKETSR